MRTVLVNFHILAQVVAPPYFQLNA